MNSENITEKTETPDHHHNIQNLHWWNFLNDLWNALLLPLRGTMSLFAWIFSAPWWLLLSVISTGIIGSFYVVKKYFRRQAKLSAVGLHDDSRNKACGKLLTVGFFHPYCNAGGGGERVLWCAIRALQKRYDFVKCVVYTGDVYCNPKEIITRARDRFNIDIKRNVHFVYLNRRGWVTAERYPILTLLCQSLGSIILGLEALYKFTPDVYIDTMGYAFTLPLFRYLGGCKVGSYVHYPTISTDMLTKVNERRIDFNNAGYIAQNPVLSRLKIVYYQLFALAYGWCGSCSDVVMVNSTWTLDHINAIWKIPQRTSVVYPPCDTKSLQELYMDENESGKLRPFQIVSVAQFRPEKNHSLQLMVFSAFLKTIQPAQRRNYKLLLVGSCRNEADHARVEILKKEAEEFGMIRQVEFCLNVSYETLLQHLAQSTVGIHTMKDEHFGIGVVEFMAGGLVTLAHDSAGPKMDIVIDWNDRKTGFLADSVHGYTEALRKIFRMSPAERYQLCMNARDCVKNRFSEDTFKRRFLAETEVLLN